MTIKESQTDSVQESSRIRNQRLQKLEKINSLGLNPYPYKFERTHKNSELQVSESFNYENSNFNNEKSINSQSSIERVCEAKCKEQGCELDELILT